MSLKAIIGKVFGGKPPNKAEENTEEIQHEISFAQTMTEPLAKDKAVGEIEIFVNGEKTNIYDISGTKKIGRDPSQADIAIPELIVSKLHCNLYVKDGDVFVKDENSTNGTFVNSQKITDHKLETNDVISLGKKGTVRVVYHKHSDAPPQQTTEPVPEPTEDETTNGGDGDA
ncbi:MAG: FHA domain-containing protein [bacterium]|nr:FHA domain-containing protein [bacterium]